MERFHFCDMEMSCIVFSLVWKVIVSYNTIVTLAVHWLTIIKMDRKYKSGSQKRKLYKEKEFRNSELLKKIPKLSTIFSRDTITIASTTESEVKNETKVDTEMSQQFGTRGRKWCGWWIGQNKYKCRLRYRRSYWYWVRFKYLVVHRYSSIGFIIVQFVINLSNRSDALELDWKLLICNHTSQEMVRFNIFMCVCVYKEKVLFYELIWISGPSTCQNFGCNFKTMRNEENRCFSLAFMKRTLVNGDIVERDWLVFSLSEQSVFCFMCRLFEKPIKAKEFVNIGFKDWKNATRRFKYHENSAQHHNNNLTHFMRSKHTQTKTLDSSFIIQFEREGEYWRKVLQRIITTVKFLYRRGLSFRGTGQLCGSNHNGNLGMLAFLSEYDSEIAYRELRKSRKRYTGNVWYFELYFLRRKFKNKLEFAFSSFSGRASYLSANVCEEIISLLAREVLQQ